MNWGKWHYTQYLSQWDVTVALIRINYIVILGIAFHNDATDNIHADSQDEVDDDRVDEQRDVPELTHLYLEFLLLMLLNPQNDVMAQRMSRAMKPRDR